MPTPVESIIMRNMTLSEVDNPLTRDGMKWKNVSAKTLRKHMIALSEVCADKLKAILPDKFGIMFDGWSCGSTHFFAISACFMDNKNVYHEKLMAIQPLLDETSLSAANQIALIEFTTEYYDRTSSDSVIFLIGDNCEMNQKTATDMGVPLIGCSSHKFALAVARWIEEQPGLTDALEVLSTLMS